MRGVRWVKAILIIFLALFITGSVWAEEDSKYISWYETPIQYKYISLKVITECLGALEDSVYSYCDVADQKIIFENFRERIKKEILSSSPRIHEDRTLIYAIFDIILYENKKRQIFIEVYYYRGGNCAECFYYELYNDKGELISTDKDRINLYGTKKFLQVIKKYENFKRSLGLKEKKGINIWEDIMKKGGKL